jgi:predicted esterase
VPGTRGSVVLALALGLASVAQAAETLTPGVLTERVPIASHPEESYALYLPSSYSPTRPSPILYAFDPRARGRVPVERFQAAAERYGWIVAGSNASRNRIAVTDIVARLWDDTHKRLALDDGRVYTTGFSGGARVASGMALGARGRVAGVVAYGAGFPSGARAGKDVPFILFGGAGRDDFNLPEMRQLAADLDAAGVAHRLEVWDGGHEWAPVELCTLSLEWLELAAMRAGTRAKDDALVERWMGRDVARARQRETAGALVEAAEAFDSLIQDFRGLRDTAEYAQAAARLRGSKAYKDELRNQKADDGRQARLTMELGTAIQQLSGDADDGRVAALTSLRASIASLRRESEKQDGGRQAHLARRVLSGAWAQAFEASSGLRAGGEYRRAAETLTLAGEIRPLAAGQLYELARLHALCKQDAQALKDLAAAIEAGFRDADAMAQEPDFDRIRRGAEFPALLDRVRTSPRIQ